MDKSVAETLIAATASIAVAALSYLFTKMKEREADWRKYKFDQYREFLCSVSGIVGSDSTPEGQQSFAKASNTLHLIGSKGVIEALHHSQDGIKTSNRKLSDERHDTLLSRLIWEIRRDVQIPGTPEASDFSARLWCSGTSDVKKLDK
jgi:hypothetical protein